MVYLGVCPKAFIGGWTEMFFFSPQNMPKEEGGKELEISARIRSMEQAWDLALQHSGTKTEI